MPASEILQAHPIILKLERIFDVGACLRCLETCGLVRPQLTCPSSRTPQVYQTVSGLHHPDTFNCLTSLVALLRGAGKASQALPLAQRCLAVKKKSLGELHPDTAASMQVVADVMLDLGK